MPAREAVAWSVFVSCIMLSNRLHQCQYDNLSVRHELGPPRDWGRRVIEDKQETPRKMNEVQSPSPTNMPGMQVITNGLGCNVVSGKA
jgi:hypothetical protein